ncbi:MAG: AAA family ATPase [Candidatus Hadarchaeales archaeon]
MTEQPKISTVSLPKQMYFFGREAEINEIVDFMASETCRVLVLKGIAGIGKTALIAKLVEMYRSSKHILYIKIYPYTTLRGLLGRVAEFLQELGRENLKRYLEGREIELEGLFNALRKDLDRSNLLLILDDVHYAVEEITKILTPLLDVLDGTDAKVVVSGRMIPKFYDKRDTLVRRRLKEEILWGLDEAAAAQLLRQRGIDEKYIQEIYQATAGHPLMLELVKPGSVIEAAEFIEKEIVESLTFEEKKFLEAASVFRAPFSRDAIEGDPDTMRKLTERLLIREVDGKFEVHEMIKNIFYGKLTAEEKVGYHRAAAEFYLKLGTSEAIVEAIYHLIKGYRQQQAASMAIEHGFRLIEEGYGDALLSELSMIEEAEVPDFWPYIKILSGDIYSEKGRFEDAIKEYETCIEYTGAGEPRGGREMFAYMWFGVSKELLRAKALAYLRIGELQVKRGKIEEAREAYQQALKVLRELKSPDADEIERKLQDLEVMK